MGVLVPVRGGVFQAPAAVTQLMANLPPPVCFRGPFVSIDDLFGIFLSNPHLTGRPVRPEGIPNGHKFLETAIKASSQQQGRGSPITTNNSNNNSQDTRPNNNINSNNNHTNNKRVPSSVFEEDDDNTGDGDNSNSGFSADIYRNRKIKSAKLSAL